MSWSTIYLIAFIPFSVSLGLASFFTLYHNSGQKAIRKRNLVKKMGSEFDIFDKSWKIYSRNDPYPPQIICEDAVVNNSLITVGSLIEGTVINSLLGANVKVRKGAVVENSVLFEGVEVREGAKVNYSIIAENTIIKKNANIGYDAVDAKKITVVASDLKIEHNVKVPAGEMVEKDIKE